MSGRGNLKDWSADERAQKMAAMQRQGMTLEKIGEHFNLTRERVRQIIGNTGQKNARHGFVAAMRQEEAEHKRAAFEARIRAHWGVPLDVWRQCRADGVVRSFENQRSHANMRAIEWRLTFGQWLAIWQASGKLELRGRGKGRYCMSRIKDSGGYVLGNVHIQLATENSREAIAKWVGKTKPNRGVFLLYPGTATPWCARYGKKGLGRHATEAEAVEAREKWLAANPPKRGLGYTIRGGRYQVQVGRTYVGTFATAEEAKAARAAHLSTCEAA